MFWLVLFCLQESRSKVDLVFSLTNPLHIRLNYVDESIESELVRTLFEFIRSYMLVFYKQFCLLYQRLIHWSGTFCLGLFVFRDEPSCTVRSCLLIKKKKKKNTIQSFLSSVFCWFMRRLRMSGLATVVLVFFKIFSTLEYRVKWWWCSSYLWTWRKFFMAWQVIDLGRLLLWTLTMLCSMHFWIWDFWRVGGILGFS